MREIEDEQQTEMEAQQGPQQQKDGCRGTLGTTGRGRPVREREV
jgi:hypothetical protein